MRSSQGGNAILIVLIGVMLFGALAAVFMRGARTGMGNLTAQQSKMAAQDIVTYGQQMEAAVNRLRQNGCSESEFDFENAVWILHDTTPIWPAGMNPNAPATGCDIFNEGKATAKTMPMSYFVPTTISALSTEYGSYKISEIQMPGAGNASDSDLVMFLPRIPTNLCMDINKMTGVENLPTTPPACTMTGNAWIYKGDFSTSTDTLADDSGKISGKTGYCCTYNGTLNAFYYVLLPR